MRRRTRRGLIAIGAVFGLAVSLALLMGSADLAPRAQTAGPSALYWADSFASKLQRSNLDGSDVSDLATADDGLGLPHGIAFDGPSNRVYWSDLGTGSIHRAHPDGSGIETLVTDLDFPRWLEIDSNAGKLYWTDSARNTLGRADLDGSNPETLLTDLANPIGIAVDSDAARVYWVNSTDRRIQRADLDGSNVVDFRTAADGVGSPVDLAMDAQGGQLYWTDALVGGQIKRAPLDGSTAVESVIDRASSPQGLAVDGHAGKVYWATSETFSIQRVDLDGSNRETVVADLAKPRGVSLGN